MKKIFLILLLPLFAQAQINLVPNPSFEELVDCPGTLNIAIEHTTHWFNTTTHSGALLFHTCATGEKYGVPDNYCGFQYPKTGDAYTMAASTYYLPSGNPTYLGEYLSIELTEELITDSLYYVGLWFSCPETFYGNGTDVFKALGIHFTRNELDTSEFYLPYYQESTTVINPNCIDSLNMDDWILLADTFKASGEEKFITIGSFIDTLTMPQYFINNPLHTTIDEEAFVSYFYIDDVFVIPLFETTDTTSNIQVLQKPRQLLRIVDMLGRETQPKKNTPLFYLYDDGTVEKRIVIE